MYKMRIFNYTKGKVDSSANRNKVISIKKIRKLIINNEDIITVKIIVQLFRIELSLTPVQYCKDI